MHHSTPDFPAPVAPTMRTWLPSSRSSHGVPSSPRHRPVRAAGGNGSTTAFSWALISSHSCTLCGLRWCGRGSRRRRTWGNPVGQVDEVLHPLAGQHPHRSLSIHRLLRTDSSGGT